MNSNWNHFKFKDIVQFSPSIKLDNETKYPFIEMEKITPGKRYVTSTEFKKYSSSGSAKFKNNDVIFARITPCLENRKIAQVELADSKYGFGSTEFFVFRAKPTMLDQSYLYYYSTSYYFVESAINSMVGASGRQRADKKYIENLDVYLPELKEQQQIAAILSAYDDLIETNNQRIATLEQLAQQIYKEWFVRMRFPGWEHTQIHHGIPDGWSLEIASNFFTIVKGKSYTSDELTENEEHMPFVTLKSFNRGGGYREDGLKYYSGRFSKRQVVFKNDIVMAVTDMTQDRVVVGRVARVPHLGSKGAVISLDVIKLVPHAITNSFLYSFMRLSGFGDYIKDFANGANVLHLKPDLVIKQRILIPSKSLQEKFSVLVEPIYEQMDILSTINKNAVLTRNLLLPRLISGKLSLKQANASL